VAKEREIATEQVNNDPGNAKKPPDIRTKIIEGRVRKAVDEFALSQQVFVKDGETTIDKLLASNKASVKAFERYEVGAGIEKKQDDFVGEVMAQVKAQTKTDPPATKH
jgi:elongation factor Ts